MQGRPGGDPGVVPHPPVGSLLLEAAGALPVAAVLVQARQASILSLSEVSFLEGLEYIAAETLDDELDELLPVGEAALEEPHDDDVMGQRHSVVVELEGVRVGQRDRKYGEELLGTEAGEHLWQRNKSGEELENRDGDVDCRRDFGQVEEDLGQQSVHCPRHLQDTRRQSHDAHLVTLGGEEATLEALDQLFLKAGL